MKVIAEDVKPFLFNQKEVKKVVMFSDYLQQITL